MEKEEKVIKRIVAIDQMNWRLERKKKNSTEFALIGYYKYLVKATLELQEHTKTVSLYYEALKSFKTLIEPQIITRTTGEHILQYDNNRFYHRDKEKIILSIFEYELKRICLEQKKDYMQSLIQIKEYKTIEALICF